MKAVILAAGEGLRLRPFTETKPKVMLPVANKPILHHVIDSLKKTTITDIYVVVGYQKNKILQYFKNFPDLNIQFIEQEKQLGTAHALLQAEQYLDDDFLVVFGDNLIDEVSLQKLIDSENPNTVIITHHGHPSKYGVVAIKNKEIEDISEKPREIKPRYIATGVYKFEKNIFPLVKSSIDNGDFGITSVIKLLLANNYMIGSLKTSQWKDVVYPWDLLSVNETYLQKTHRKIGGLIEKDVYIKGSISVGENTHISSGSYLVGPLIIGDSCEIGPHCCLYPSTVIGDNCVIEPFTCIRNSVLMDDCRIGSHTTITNAIIDNGVHIGNNVSLLEDDSIVNIGDEIKKVRNVGVMIGEESSIGNNNVIDPGVIIGKGCMIGSINHIYKNVADGKQVM